MAEEKIEVLLSGPPKPTIVNGLAPFTVHRLADAKDRDALLQGDRPARARHGGERVVRQDRRAS